MRSSLLASSFIGAIMAGRPWVIRCNQRRHRAWQERPCNRADAHCTPPDRRSRMPPFTGAHWSLPASPAHALEHTQVVPAGGARGGMNLVEPHPHRLTTSKWRAPNWRPPEEALEASLVDDGSTRQAAVFQR